MNDYNISFNNRYKKFLYAQDKYPNVMIEEYQKALNICNLNENDIFLNIPADYKSFDKLLHSSIKYIPVEINKNFSSLTNYKLCQDLSNLSFDNQSIDVILSLASLHHFSEEERKKFYKECLRLSKKLVIGDVIENSLQDKWLNEFVNKNNSCGHKGIFFSEKDIKIIESIGFKVVVQIEKYKWNFINKEEMIDFCKNLFNLDLISDDEIYEGILKYLKPTNDNSFDWELIYFICTNPFRILKKPSNWIKLPMYKKITYYKQYIGKEYSYYVDKLIAKNKVKEILGDKIEVAKVIKILKNINDIKESDINSNYLLKSSHGSGWNIDFNYCKDLRYIKKKLKEWNTNYIGSNEPHYKYLEPKFFIEEKINDKLIGITGNAIVYMFRCFHGKPGIISIKYNNKQNFYDSEWNIIEKNIDIEIPNNLSEMIYISKELSKIFEFVRIDLYLSEDKIYFSEFTFTPCGGNKFYNDHIEREYGKLWK